MKEKMIDVLVSCPTNFVVTLQEWDDKGYGHLLLKDDQGNITGVDSGKVNPLYPIAPGQLLEPSPVYLRMLESDVGPMLLEDWQTCTILAVCDARGEYENTGTEEEPVIVKRRIWDRLRENAAAVAEYLTYPQCQVPPEHELYGQVDFLEIGAWSG